MNLSRNASRPGRPTNTVCVDVNKATPGVTMGHTEISPDRATFVATERKGKSTRNKTFCGAPLDVRLVGQLFEGNPAIWSTMEKRKISRFSCDLLDLPILPKCLVQIAICKVVGSQKRRTRSSDFFRPNTTARYFTARRLAWSRHYWRPVYLGRPTKPDCVGEVQ